jgi:hypothetical protein
MLSCADRRATVQYSLRGRNTVLSSHWDKSIPNGRCLNVNTLTYTHAAISIFQDLIILVLPIAELSSLKLERRRKIAVFFVFQVGALYAKPHIPSLASADLYSACVTAMIRLRYLAQFGGTKSLDPTCWSFN